MPSYVSWQEPIKNPAPDWADWTEDDIATMEELAREKLADPADLGRRRKILKLYRNRQSFMDAVEVMKVILNWRWP
jgi:hypothetical protein